MTQPPTAPPSERPPELPATPAPTTPPLDPPTAAPPAVPPATVRIWKQGLSLVLGLLLTAAVVGAAWRITHPPPPPPRGSFLPLRILGAPPPEFYDRERPRPLHNATIRFQTRDAADQPLTSAVEIAVDAMGVANLQYRPGYLLHLSIAAPGYAPREMWLENPEQFRLDSPDFIVTLDRERIGPRVLPVWVVVRPPSMTEKPVPLDGIALHFSVEPPPADPQAPPVVATPDPPQTPVTDSEGRAMLTWLPNRGARLRIEVPGFKPFRAHFLDAFDFERRHPAAVILLDPAADRP